MGSDEVEVCKEFLRNNCTRDGCRFAHPPPNVERRAQDVWVCQKYRLGQCDKEDCKRYHPTPEQLAHCKDSMEVCKYYNVEEGCKRGTACMRAHPAPSCSMPQTVKMCLEFYTKKECNRGDECRYYHDMAGNVSLPPPRIDGLPHSMSRPPSAASMAFPPSVVQPPALGGSFGQQASFVPSHIGVRVGGPNECRDYIHGKCFRGMECRYDHLDPTGRPERHDRHGRGFAPPMEPMMPLGAPMRAAPMGPMMPRPGSGPPMNGVPPCKNFARGNCSRNDGECRFSHDTFARCPEFMAGQCFRGSRCLFSHETRDACLDYVHNRCTRGADCRFSHQVEQLPPLPDDDARGAKRARAPQIDSNPRMHSEGSHRRASDSGAEPPPLRARRPLGGDPFSSAAAETRAGARAPCKNFAVGKCSFADCKYVHDVNVPCPDFVRGTCVHGSTCRFQHA